MPPPDATIAKSSTTARPADKGATDKGPDPALVRRCVDALVSLAAAEGKSMRRATARAIVMGHAAKHGPELDGWAHWLRNWHQISDPTGESVARNLARECR